MANQNQPQKWSPPTTPVAVDTPMVPMTVQGHRFTIEELTILKENIANKITVAEFLFFLLYCDKHNLDPFGDAYPVPRMDNTLGRVKMVIQLGINAFRARAHASGQYDGMEGPQWKAKGREEPWLDVWEEDEPPSVARVIIWRKDYKYPFVGIARWKDYGEKADPKSLWFKIGPEMLAKVAEKKAQERAFPWPTRAYIDEEMDQMGRRLDVTVEDHESEPDADYVESVVQEVPVAVTNMPTVVESATVPSLLIGEADIEALTNMYYYLGETDWFLFLTAAGVRADAIEAYTPDECQMLYNAWDGFLASNMTQWQTSAISGLTTKIKGMYPRQLTDASVRKFRMQLTKDAPLTVAIANQLLVVYTEMELVLSLALTSTTDGIFDEDLKKLREMMAPSGNVLEMWLPDFAAKHDEYLVLLYSTMFPEIIPDEGLRARFVAAQNAMGLAPVEEEALPA